MSELFIVSTPIGNLGDITYRAVETLRDADVILAEDTRRTATLLRHYGIQGRLVSAHEHNEKARAETLAEMLREGKRVALVSDAGTPLLSDPGSRLVRRAIAEGFRVTPVPGASALLATLVASGISAERFTFYGFIPRKGGSRRALLEEIAQSPYASVLYESPHRTAELLRDLADAAGAEREVAIGRELTKLHEEFVRGTLGDARIAFGEAKVRGEIVVVLAGRADDGAETEAAEEQAARALAAALLDGGLAPSAVAKEVKKRLGISRNAAYEMVQELADEERNEPL